MFHRSTLVLFLCVGALVFRFTHLPDAQAARVDFFQQQETVALKNAPAKIVSDPDRGQSDQRLYIELLNPATPHTKIKIRVTTGLLDHFAMGDLIELSCMVRQPEPFNGFAYDKYLLRYGAIGVCSNAQLRTIGHADSTQSTIVQTKHMVLQKVRAALPAPENGLIAGIVFGEMRAIPDQQLEYFQRSGTSHLLVISGSNIALIAQWVRLLLARYCNYRTTIALTMVAIALYVIMTGIQSSALRAAVFGCIVLLAEFLRRPSDGVRALLYVATIMALINPLMPLYDPGFQLSFLASLGMLLCGTPLQKLKLMQAVPETAGLREALATTLAATIITTPFIAYQFQTFSPVSVFANIILVPLMSSYLLIGIIVSGICVISPMIGFFICLPLYFLFRLTYDLVELFGSLSFASIPVTTLSLNLVLATYAAVAAFAWKKMFYYKRIPA
jgi:competence protein ComEC